MCLSVERIIETLISQIKTSFSCAEKKNFTSFLLSAILGTIVCSGQMLRSTKKVILRIGDVQSLIVFVIVYILLTPISLLLYMFSGKFMYKHKKSEFDTLELETVYGSNERMF